MNGRWRRTDGPDADGLSLLDEGLPEVVSRMLGISAERDVDSISDLLHAVSSENPLRLRPSEKERYGLMVGRFLLDEYMSAGFDPSDDAVMDVIRRPGPTRCCNPYSDNMYRHLVATSRLKTDGDRYRIVFA